MQTRFDLLVMPNSVAIRGSQQEVIPYRAGWETAQPARTMSYVYDYPRPCVTCDAVVFDFYQTRTAARRYDDIPHVLLVLRKNDPFKGMWALPGGFLNEDEELEECAARELFEETGLDVNPNNLQQAFAVGRKVRDPRARIISVVYTTVVDRFEQSVCADDDAEKVAWFPMDDLPSLAADHLDIIRNTLGRVYHDRS